jgi:hypothetical protein
VRHLKPSTLRPAASEKCHTVPPETDQAGCRRWVNRVTSTVRRSLPVFPYNQTYPGVVAMSQMCQFRPHAPQQTAALLDHHVGAGEQRRWHVNSERLGSLHIDDQFEMGWLFDR